mgnify:CR=1 FL=1|tara:strand:- start:107 stop:397 length:291 start_codon:yes stop_codon:yes gene_type:complete
MNVKLIRMWSGEDVIADLIKENDDSIVIQNPIFAVPQGEGQVGFAPWSPLLKGRDIEIDVTKRYVVYITDTQDDIIDQYKEMYAPIATPPRKKLIL